MVINSYYLSTEENAEKLQEDTELSMDEIEAIVGRFPKHSHRAGELRGEVIEKVDGEIIIRHHFTKRILWSNLC